MDSFDLATMLPGANARSVFVRHAAGEDIVALFGMEGGREWAPRRISVANLSAAWAAVLPLARAGEFVVGDEAEFTRGGGLRMLRNLFALYGGEVDLSRNKKRYDVRFPAVCASLTLLAALSPQDISSYLRFWVIGCGEACVADPCA